MQRLTMNEQSNNHRYLQQQNDEDDIALPFDIICEWIAPYLDRCSYNQLGLCCQKMHQHLYNHDDDTSLLPYWPASVPLFLQSCGRCLSFSANGQWLVCGDMHGQVTFWNRISGKATTVWRPGGRDADDDDDDNTSSASAIPSMFTGLVVPRLTWINTIVVWKNAWVICSNTESNSLFFYHIQTQQRLTKTLPQLIRQILTPKDKYLYVLTGATRYATLGDNMFVCKDIDLRGTVPRGSVVEFEHCYTFPKYVQDVVALDATKFICWTKKQNITNDDDVVDAMTTVQIVCWDQKTGISRCVPLTNITTTISKSTDDDEHTDNVVIDSDTTVLAIASNTGSKATGRKILFGVAYQTGRRIWIDMYWYDWWMEDHDDDQCWKHHGRYPLHEYCHNISTLKLIDENTWIIADAARAQCLACQNDNDDSESIRVLTLQANANRFDIAVCNYRYVSWISWGSTLWIRDIYQILKE